MGRLEGKVAVITGGGRGIGRAASLLFAREGAKVALTDVLDQDGADVVREVEKSGGKARFFHVDVSDEEQVRSAFAKIHEEWGRIDVLVNNAGISGVNKPTDEIALEQWNEVMAVNVNGVFLCTKHVIPYLRKAGGGSIVNISSIYGLVGAPDSPPYHAAKGAVRLMSKTDALLYAKEGIRVNSIHPGFIWTPMVESFLRESGDLEAGKKAIAELHPIGHMGEPEDVAYGALYLASSESKFVTGSELIIDGGYTAR